MKNLIYLIGEIIFVYLFANKLFIKEKRIKPSLLSFNVVWFTYCSWIDQLLAFKHIERYNVKY